MELLYSHVWHWCAGAGSIQACVQVKEEREEGEHRSSRRKDAEKREDGERKRDHDDKDRHRDRDDRCRMALEILHGARSKVLSGDTLKVKSACLDL